jgi:hypothetical protein
MAKKDDSTQEPKAKRTVRTIDERIAELERLREQRESKAKARESKEFTDLTAKFDKQLDAMVATAVKVNEIAGKLDFDLPDGIIVLDAGIHVGTDVEINEL